MVSSGILYKTTQISVIKVMIYHKYLGYKCSYTQSSKILILYLSFLEQENEYIIVLIVFLVKEVILQHCFKYFREYRKWKILHYLWEKTQNKISGNIKVKSSIL